MHIGELMQYHQSKADAAFNIPSIIVEPIQQLLDAALKGQHMQHAGQKAGVEAFT